MEKTKGRQAKIFLNLIKKKEKPLFLVVPNQETIVNMTKTWVKENFEDTHFIYKKHETHITPTETIGEKNLDTLSTMEIISATLIKFLTDTGNIDILEDKQKNNSSLYEMVEWEDDAPVVGDINNTP